MVVNERDFTDVSESLGAPFGGFGTGYFVYGRHGFVNWNVGGFPESQQTKEYPHTMLWDYYATDPEEAPVALYVNTEGETYLMQTRPSSFAEGKPCRDFSMKVDMPSGLVTMVLDDSTNVRLMMYSSVKPHDIARTSIPACVIEVTFCNQSESVAEYTIGLAYKKEAFSPSARGEYLVLSDNAGHVCFGMIGGIGGRITVTVDGGCEKTVVCALGWFYPYFKIPGNYAAPEIAPDDIFRQNNIADNDYKKSTGSYVREYVLRYKDATAAVQDALENHVLWKEDIEKWHESFRVPAEIRHVWFGSYASLITATLNTTEGFYFEIEQPHGFLNTMDVSVYSAWIYLINWPEVEHRDLEQYIAAIPKEGENAGKVWHSLWADGSHYVEEAIYAVRIWRYFLWSGDREFLRKAFPSVKIALEFIYSVEGRGNLINNKEGNQSYDAWKMPGIGAYVNIQWLFALYSFRKMCMALDEPCKLAGRDLNEFLEAAVKEYNDLLWDSEGGYWHAYRPTEDSIQVPFGSAVFSDQLFGHWAVAIDKDSHGFLEECMEKMAALKIYNHNRIEETAAGYSCWTNGMMPERERTIEIDLYKNNSGVDGYHALTCWVSTQMELASMLGYFGLEKESLDVFMSVSKGMGKNVLAVGEYNRTVDGELKAVTSWQEPGKDTPRFPPYPRYKSSWEYLICLLGLKLSLDNITLSPFKTISFSISDVVLAGVKLTVRVEKGWTKCYVNGQEAVPVISRDIEEAIVEFLNE